MYQHCENPFAIKQRRKSVDLSPKPCFWASKQHCAIHFLLATCNVCPLTIPEFFAQTWVSDYWQLIHWWRFLVITSCKTALEMQINYYHPLTFGMTVPLFTETFYRVKGTFFNKIRLLIIYIFHKRNQGRSFQT